MGLGGATYFQKQRLSGAGLFPVPCTCLSVAITMNKWQLQLSSESAVLNESMNPVTFETTCNA